MKTVGIKQLKARLSEYVRFARAGETIVITDRGDVVAQMGPARAVSRAAGSLDEILDRLAGEGVVTRAALPKRGWTWNPKGLGLPEGTAQRLLDEIRADR